MTPADQEFVHNPEAGQHGDCQRAVIASLLDLPISAVPHFLQEAQGDPTIYWETLQAFVRSHGFAYLTVPARAGIGFFGDDGDVYHEISGPSPRGNGVTHAVVGRNGEVVFDPHPSRAGLAGDPATWEHAYLVRVTDVAPVVQGNACFLQETDYLLLHRFIETTDDDESYDIGKDAVRRLAELGAVQSHGFGRYSVTMFGHWVHERFWHQNPPLPLMTNSDRDRATQAQQGGAA